MKTTKKEEWKELNRLHASFKKAAKQLVGYPLSLVFDYSKLFRFLKFHINNVGDPYSGGGYLRINTLKIEKKVIDRFAELFHAPMNDYWGHVTNGGTEGNLYGLFVARELYPDGIVFYSDQTHYSVPKNIRLLRMESKKIHAQENGEIDYAALKRALIANRKEGTPILFANIGTTMKGAIDDISKIRKILSDLKIKKYYLHCDAAFFGMILPFIPNHPTEVFDFRAGIDSIAISGHKMIGTPIPCGAVLTKNSHASKIGTFIEYVGVLDKTIAGSRNGLTPLFLWHELIYAEQKQFKNKIQSCIKKADYAVNKFNSHGIKAWRNPDSIIVVFPRPSEKIARKWQLAVEDEISHLITLPHVSYQMINQLIKEVVAERKKRKK